MLLAVMQLPRSDAAAGTATPDPINTVGLALLAYGLVQLLGKVVDRLLSTRSSDRTHVGSFSEEDRKRLERSAELGAETVQRLEKIQEMLAIQQRLVGEALDEVRISNGKLDGVSRKLRALWSRFGRRFGEDGKA